MTIGRSPNLSLAEQEIRRCIREIEDPRNDGYTQMNCKYQLYQLKCLLDDAYPSLPEFYDEAQWEQQRLINILKR